MSSIQTMEQMTGGSRVVKSETKTVTRGGVTETTTTEVIETYSSAGAGSTTKTTKTVTTSAGAGKTTKVEHHHHRKGSSSSSSSSDSSSKGHKKNKLHALMAKIKIKSPEHHSGKSEHNSSEVSASHEPKSTSPDHSNHKSTKSSSHSKGKQHASSSRSSSGSDSDSDDEKDFAKSCLKWHNHYRALHGVPKLKLSKKLCKYAEEWATKLAREDTFRHRDDHKYGENIFMKWHSDPHFKISGKDPVESWYSEIKCHEFGKEPASLASGHFSQVVWKDAKEFGVGKARSKNGKIIVVANYDPPGNIIGKFTLMVLPLTK